MRHPLPLILLILLCVYFGKALDEDNHLVKGSKRMCLIAIYT